MLVLDLFCGTKSVKKITDKLNWDYIGLDIEKKFNPDILIDFLEWDYKKYDKKHFDRQVYLPYSFLNISYPFFLKHTAK